MKKITALIFLIFIFQSCHVGRFFIYNFADIKDYKKFPFKEIKKSVSPFYFTEASLLKFFKLPKVMQHKSKSYSFEDALKSSKTVAFIAIRNDSVLYEWYAPKYNPSSIVPSFSMAKSYISALVGIAIDEGKIKNTNESICTYLDFLNKDKFGSITIQHLLDMQSGIKNNESYINPFGDVAKYYYGTNLRKYMKHIKYGKPPGAKFEYLSLNTQLLALIVEKATGENTTSYFQNKIWSKIGTEFDATWSIDSRKHQTEKAFCCLNSRAKDYAKFGRLYLNNGNWNGEQVISEKWVKASVNFNTPKNDFLYSNQWWHTRNSSSVKDTLKIKGPYAIKNYTDKNGINRQYVIYPSGHYHAEGILGQFIYVAPEKNIIFVRLGRNNGWIDWWELFKGLANAN